MLIVFEVKVIFLKFVSIHVPLISSLHLSESETDATRRWVGCVDFKPDQASGRLICIFLLQRTVSETTDYGGLQTYCHKLAS